MKFLYSIAAMTAAASILGTASAQESTCTGVYVQVNAFTDDACQNQALKMSQILKDAYALYNLTECTSYLPNQSYNYDCGDTHLTTKFYPDLECVNDQGVKEFK